jgi:pilus assembly protein CpaB
MKPSRILLLLIAIVAGGLAAFLATRGSGPTTIIEAAAPPQQSASKVLVAKVPIGVGERLNANQVEWQSWPQGDIRPEYITIAQTPDAPAKIAGAVARFEIFQGEPILDAKLVHSDQGFLSAVLAQGMRGVSVPVSAASGSGGFIIPNDRVDVVVTSSAQGQTTSRVLLSDVKVLAIGTRLGQSGTTGAPTDPADPKSQIFTSDSIATLELSPPQADTLINATATGKISLVLRSVADFAKNTTPGAVIDTPVNNQSVKIIRFGRELNVMAGTADNSQATLNAAAYVPPALPIVVSPPVAAAVPSESTTAPDGTVTSTVTTVTPPAPPSTPAPAVPVQ